MLDVTEHYSVPLISGSAPTVGALPALQDTLVFTGSYKLYAAGGRLIIGAAAATNVTLTVVLYDNVNAQTALIPPAFLAQVPAAAVIDFGGALPHPIIVSAAHRIVVRAEGTAAGVDHSLAATSIIDAFIP